MTGLFGGTLGRPGPDESPFGKARFPARAHKHIVRQIAAYSMTSKSLQFLSSHPASDCHQNRSASTDNQLNLHERLGKALL